MPISPYSNTITVTTAAGFDSDASAFFTRVTSAGGSLSTTEQNAINQFVIDLKGYSLWSKMIAIYPMVGASAAACAQNLKSSSFTGSFVGGVTYASTGITGNGSSGYMDTGIVPANHFASFDSGASIYSRTNRSDTSYDYGVTETGGIGHNVYLNYSGVGMRWHLQCVFADRPSITPSGTDSSGFFTGVTGAANDRRMYKNGSLLASNTNTSTTSLSTFTNSMPIMCQRNSGSYSNFSQRQYGLFAFHSNLTATEVSNFNTANSTFQTALSR